MTNLYIIAEAAQGYEGSVECCNLLIRSAKAAGADAIKFQAVYADDLAEVGYQYYHLYKSLEMTLSDWEGVRAYASTIGIDFIIDIFGAKALELAKSIQPDGIKIHSTNFFDTCLISKVLRINNDVYFSIAGIYESEILSIIEEFELNRRKNIHFLYGFQSEPTPLESNNLLRINKLREKTGIESVGFMDHSNGAGQYNILLSSVALGLGVKLFEKHITLDRALEMEDYVSALGVSDFKNYVGSLRQLSTALGSDELQLTLEEEKYRSKSIKRVLAAKSLNQGEIITEEDLVLNRPQNPKGFFRFNDLIGKKLKKDLKKGEVFTDECI